MTYALDSNIVSYLLKEKGGVIARLRRVIDNGDEVVIPPIVFYEVQGGLLAKNLLKRLADFEAFVQSTKRVEFVWPIWQRATEIYASLSQKGRLIDDLDLLIAAFCLEKDYMLVTNNLRHFERIDGLKLVNWQEEGASTN